LLLGWVNPEAFFREHWMPCVYLLPAPTPIQADTSLNLNTYHDDYCYWFDLGATLPPPAQPSCSCGVHNSLDRYALRQLHDEPYKA